MIKPIFTVGVPMDDIPYPERDDYFVNVTKALKSKTIDYRLIVYPLYEGKNFKFNCFNDKDYEPLNYKDIEEYIKSKIDGKQ